MASFGTGGEDADFSSRAGNDDAKDSGCDLGKHGTRLEGGGALRHLHADRLEMEEPGQRRRSQPHGSSFADDADAGAGGGCALLAQDPAAAA